MQLSSESTFALVEPMATLFDAIPVGIYVLQDGCFAHVNQTFAEALGYPRDELLALRSAADVIVEHERVLALTRAESLDTNTVQVRCRNGRVIETEIRGAIVDGKRVLVGTVRDLADRRKLEQELQQMHRLTSIGRVAAQAAHEFNNVMMGIQPVVDVMRRLAGTDPKRLRLVQLIAASIARGKRVTTDILRFGKPSQPSLHPVDAGELLRQVSDEIRSLLPPGVFLNVHFPDAPLHALADHTQISQVLINLALNARDAMDSRGGTLMIAVNAAEDRAVEFSVSDTGHGISRDDLPYIFEPLFSTKRNGTGLGLSIVSQIIHAHDGAISVESEPETGSTFRFRIPSAAEESDAIDETSIAEEHSPHARRVLIVEEDETIGAALQLSLEVEGIDASVVSRATAVLPAIERMHPDVVILDLALPDDEGASVYARIAQRFDLPVIFSSSHAREREIELLLASPRTAFLMKPYPTAELLNVMETLLAERERV